MKYDFVLIVDHFQFYLEDDHRDTDTSNLWDDQASRNLIAVAPGVISVGTARYGGAVAVTVETRSSAPDDALDAWDQVTECSIEVKSGRLVLWSPETNFAAAPSIDLPTGTYRARIYYGQLDTVEDEFATSGDDNYRIVLWPSDLAGTTIIKRKS